MDEITIRDDEEVDVFADPFGREGNRVGLVDGQDLVWRSSDPGVATVVQDPGDPLRAVVRASGPTGLAQVTASLTNPDGDPATADDPLTYVCHVRVVPSRPVAVRIRHGLPRPRTGP